MGDTLLISDLHLSVQRPGTTAALLDLLRGRAREARALYVLGDLFDAWIGDDDLAEPMHAQVASALRAVADSGVPVRLMHGNRDFLLGEAFARAAGASLLHDPTVIEIAGERTVLAHGDTLCTEDRDYAAFRAQVRDPAWQRGFLARPLDERRAEAARLRAASEAGKRLKAAQIMDVTPQAVVDLLRAHGCRRLIHGHTHRPGRQAYEVDGAACERWVLPDWDSTPVGLAVAAEDGRCRYWSGAADSPD